MPSDANGSEVPPWNGRDRERFLYLRSELLCDSHSDGEFPKLCLGWCFFFLWQVGMYTCILNWGPYDEFFFGGVVWDEWSQGDYFEATNLKFGSRLEMYILGGGFKYVFHFHRSPLLGEMIQFD